MSYLPLSYYDHPRLHQRESPRLLEAASARREHRAALPGSVKERMLKIWRKLSETTTSDVPHLSYLDLPAMFFCLFYIKGRNSSQNVQNRLVSSQSPFIRIIIHIIPHIEYTVYIYEIHTFFPPKSTPAKIWQANPSRHSEHRFPFFPRLRRVLRIDHWTPKRSRFNQHWTICPQLDPKYHGWWLIPSKI